MGMHTSAQMSALQAGVASRPIIVCAFKTGASAHTQALSRAGALRFNANKRATISLIATGIFWAPSEALANVLQDYVERSQRPEMTPEQALVMLLDARGVLNELKGLAATAPNSDERFRARSLLPGMAKRLRQVGQAAPVVIAEATGGDKRSTLSKEYGGKGDEAAVAVPIYRAIGQVITISGRTIKKEAQADPGLAEAAIGKIDELLGLLPREELDRAQRLREARRRGSLEIRRPEVPRNAIAAL